MLNHRSISCALGFSLCLASFSIATAADQAVTLHGMVVATMYSGDVESNGDPTQQQVLTNAVNLTFSRDGRWLVECKRMHPVGDPMYGKDDFTYLSFDGSDCYYVHYSEFIRQRRGDKSVLVGPTPIASKINRGYISKGNYPAAPYEDVGEKFGHVLWVLCGAGQAYHANPDKEIPLPWVPARWNLSAYGFRSEAELSAAPLYIPRQFRFVRDSALDLGSLDAEMEREQLDKPSNDDAIKNLNADLHDRLTFWTNGFVAGELKTLQFTNWNGLELPLQFVVKTYNPQLLAPGKLSDRYVGTFTNITVASVNESYQPPMLSQVGVIDSRLRFRDKTRQVDAVNYRLAATNEWPSAKSSLLTERMAAFAADPSAARYPKPSARRTRFVAMSFILLASFSVPLLLYRQARRKPRVEPL